MNNHTKAMSRFGGRGKMQSRSKKKSKEKAKEDSNLSATKTSLVVKLPQREDLAKTENNKLEQPVIVTS